MVRRILAVLTLVTMSFIAGPAVPSVAAAPPADLPAAAPALPDKQHAGDQLIDSLDGVWYCWLPSGYVYTSVRYNSQCNSGSNTEYLLRIPVDQMWACFVPGGFTFSSQQYTSGCGQYNIDYYFIRIPYDGLTACSVSPGYTYDYAYYTSQCGQLNNYLYHMRLPYDGLWACTMPVGYTYDTWQYSSSCPNGYLYHLRRL